MVDFYRKRLNHFGWTWLERKGYRGFHSRHDRTATKLARAYSKRNVQVDIGAEIESHDMSIMDFLDCHDTDCVDCDPSRAYWLWWQDKDNESHWHPDVRRFYIEFGCI